MENNRCFVCLNKSCNKVCSTCKCFAHPKCWGNYLKNICGTTRPVYNEPGLIIIDIPYSVSCPQCRNNIFNVKPVTRSDTKFARYELLLENLDTMIDTINNCSNIADKDDILRDIFDTVIKNKKFILHEPKLVKVFNEKLKELYMCNWYPSNLYYYMLNSKQIFT